MKKLCIEHLTQYAYEQDVILAQHLAYLRPQNSPWQKVLKHELIIDPEVASQESNIDAFGNHRTFFSINRPHRNLSVRSLSEVDKLARYSELDLQNTPPWEEVRDAMIYSLDLPFEPASEFVWPSPYVGWYQSLKAYAMTAFSKGRPIGLASMDLCEKIFTEFSYEAGATEIHTPLEQAFESRKGVCQDFAQIMIGCLRTLGLAAKYVSGYLLTSPPPGKPRLRGADASHAWVSVYCPGVAGNWLELDPTNSTAADQSHICLAQGRDFGDVSPLRGVIRGGGEHEFEIGVTVEESAD